MPTNDDDQPEPRHRKPGRARRRRTATTGRHLSLVESPACDCPPGFHEYGAHAPGHWPDDRTPVPPGAYPVEDLARMSASTASLLLQRATLEAEAEAAACPHIVIARDSVTGVVTYSGPFATGLEALTRAHQVLVEHREALHDLDDDHTTWPFTLTVAPLFPQ